VPPSPAPGPAIAGRRTFGTTCMDSLGVPSSVLSHLFVKVRGCAPSASILDTELYLQPTRWAPFVIWPRAHDDCGLFSSELGCGRVFWASLLSRHLSPPSLAASCSVESPPSQCGRPLLSPRSGAQTCRLPLCPQGVCLALP